jgi:hypothetical protein
MEIEGDTDEIVIDSEKLKLLFPLIDIIRCVVRSSYENQLAAFKTPFLKIFYRTRHKKKKNRIKNIVKWMVDIKANFEDEIISLLDSICFRSHAYEMVVEENVNNEYREVNLEFYYEVNGEENSTEILAGNDKEEELNRLVNENTMHKCKRNTITYLYTLC